MDVPNFVKRLKKGEKNSPPPELIPEYASEYICLYIFLPSSTTLNWTSFLVVCTYFLTVN